MRSNYSSTKAIILKRINYKDADKIITMYTKELGKISTIAKGIRKVTSRKRSHLELLNLVEVYLVESHDWYIITQAQAIKSFSRLKDNLSTTSWGYYVAEIFEKITSESEKNSKLFEFLEKTIRVLDKTKNFSIVNAFNLKLLRMNGFYSIFELRSSKLNNISQDILIYFDNIELKKYEEIARIETPIEVIQNAHLILKDYTESVLERPIKTVINFN